MIKIINKTVFNSGCDALINTVNCVGVMGTGLALEFALRYPELENQYKIDCKNKAVKTGEILPYKMNDCLVLNFPTKFHWKYPSELKWISDGLRFIKEHYVEWNVKSIAMPPLGCSNGGLNFESQVYPLIIKELSDVNIDIYVCLDSKNAEGKEKEMVDSFNAYNKVDLCVELNIKGKASESLYQCKINRFYEILDIENVGMTTYKKLFDYFYNAHKKAGLKQTTIFDFDGD